MTFDSDYEPWFQPPGAIIGPIWLVLYTMLAISFTMMLAKREEISNSNLVIGLFVIQMIANLMWPNVFNSAEYLASFLTLGTDWTLIGIEIRFTHESSVFCTKPLWTTALQSYTPGSP